MQRQIVRSGIERHADGAARQLLRRIDRRIRTHDDSHKGHDRPPPDVAAAHIGIADATVVAPFAGIVHVGLALLEQVAVGGERARLLVVRRERDLHPSLASSGRGLPIRPQDPPSRTGPRRRPPIPPDPGMVRSSPRSVSSCLSPEWVDHLISARVPALQARAGPNPRLAYACFRCAVGMPWECQPCATISQHTRRKAKMPAGPRGQVFDQAVLGPAQDVIIRTSSKTG